MAVSVKEVAAHAGVSVGTVSNVMNRPEKVSNETVRRVQASIAELGFVRNDAARQLRAGSSRAIGMVVLDIGNPFFSDLVRGAEDKATESGHAIILGNSDEKVEREGAYLDLFEEQRMHGVLISPFGDIEPRLRQLRKRGTPAVLVDRTSREGDFSSVSVDDIAGGAMAAEHLIAQGRRRIAYVCGPHEIRQVADRLTGAQNVVRAHRGATLEVLTGSALSVLEGRRAGESIIARSPQDRPDAVFAANDLMALGVLQALSKLGRLTVPDEIALIGYDDIAFAGAAVVPLSSVRQPSELIGRTAVEILLEEAADPSLEKRHVVFQPELVVRESTAGAPLAESGHRE
ncbi:MAG TPA: LacI family DNA-binding transcriptional regulator [Terrimesophilobacter sp.]|jgi:Transcriptional regulators|uniref:LacI family DNA-binding transcriptional regulator n=1 Tax=Terrimesophilobacter sp. TaxID=2906435 RepID=UPI002F95128C